MKKEVSLCDVCKKVVSVRKCDICNCDLCPSDTSGSQNVLVSGKSFGIMYFCSTCRKRFYSAKRKKTNTGEPEGEGFYDEDFQDKIFKEIKGYVKTKIVTEEL